ncbi:hypothetical protein OA92_23015 [Marinomonas sp. SBI22]|uniref:hypothetical protein n=1 Tax=unclassified Marinomonas TaxID=196814 RepID=UPI0007AF1F93|nr:MULTISPECIES: hypothetical protein [unclassified Marinomonas]KZM38662.1 hypothetical protein OA92_23015 [Marinomonas sp. SBI22]KZM39206.1 hypothetical protein OA91_22865 [Marinomonas sp. SBI8L]
MKRVSKLTKNPALTSFYGWLLFPSMYLLVGIFTSVGVSVETSFIVASPTGILGFICWAVAFIISIKQILNGQITANSLGGMLSSFIPFAFLGFAFWVAVNGGV